MDIQEKTTLAQKPSVQVASALAAIIPMALLVTWMYVIRDSVPGVSEFFLGPMLIGGGMIFWLLFLHVVVCRDPLKSLGFGIPGFWLDLLIGGAMGVGFLLLRSLMRPLLNGLFAPRPPSPEILQLIQGIAGDPWLLAIWLGPVVWIGIAGFEELWRVFVLRRLWNVFPETGGKWAVLLVLAALVGVSHGYQGPAAIISIGFKSVLMGWFFMATGRTRALIVSHAVYDSVQIIMALAVMKS
jgi:hypothetical protein